jgi:hypothetical protein
MRRVGEELLINNFFYLGKLNGLLLKILELHFLLFAVCFGINGFANFVNKQFFG